MQHGQLTRSRQSQYQRGSTLVALLVSLLLLGVLGVVLFTSLGQQGSVSTIRSSRANKPFATASSYESAAAIVACRTDYEAATQAATEYATVYGREPATISQLQSFLKDPLLSTRFTIAVDPDVPGRIEAAASGHPALPGDANCAYSR